MRALRTFGPVLCLVALSLAPIAARGEEPKDKPNFLAIDLQAKANQKLDTDFHGYTGNNLKPLPRGKQKMAGVGFVIGEKFVQLAGKRAPDFPEKVEGIAVGRKVAKLHFLHATGWSVEDGTRLGEYVVHYDDKTTETIPIVYGRDLRDWWMLPDDAAATDAADAWKDVNEASKNFRGNRVEIRLFRRTWKNPHPDKSIVSFDFISRNETICAPFLVAVAGEPPMEEMAAIEALREIGAFLEYDDRGWLTGVSLSGPGPRAAFQRGTDAVLAIVSDVPTIERLALSSPYITDAGLTTVSEMSNLRWLNLNLSRVTDAGLLQIKEMKSLERLRLHGTPITDAGLAHLGGMTNLKVLDLSQTEITDAGLSNLESIKGLEEIDLRKTRVTEAAAAALRETHRKARVAR